MARPGRDGRRAEEGEMNNESMIRTPKELEIERLAMESAEAHAMASRIASEPPNPHNLESSLEWHERAIVIDSLLENGE